MSYDRYLDFTDTAFCEHKRAIKKFNAEQLHDDRKGHIIRSLGSFAITTGLVLAEIRISNHPNGVATVFETLATAAGALGMMNTSVGHLLAALDSHDELHSRTDLTQ